MTTANGLTGSVGWLFTIPAHQPVTTALLGAAGLPAEPLAGVRLRLARVSPAGKWHQAPPDARAAPCCPHLRQAIRRGREVVRAEAGLLDGAGLCGWCVARLMVPGP